MRRVVSHVPSEPKTTWLSSRPSWISSEPAAIRASSCSARAGMIASSSGSVAVDRGLLDGEPVRVGRRHHDLARLEAHEDPGEHRAALVTRRAAADAGDGLDQRVAVDGVQRRGVDVGQAREVLGRVRVQPVVRRAGRDDDDRLLGTVLDRHLAVGQRARDVEQQPARHDRHAFAGDLRLDRARSESSMSVAARCSRPASARSWIPPSTSTAVRVETPRATSASSRQARPETVILSPVPTTVSESIILKNSL